MDEHVFYVFGIFTILNLIPLSIKIYNNKTSTGLIHFINGETMALLWIFITSYAKKYKNIYMLMLYGLVIFQLVFLVNVYVL